MVNIIIGAIDYERGGARREFGGKTGMGAGINTAEISLKRWGIMILTHGEATLRN